MVEPIRCPVCSLECLTLEGTEDMQCPACSRAWYRTQDPVMPIASRGRRVVLTRLPEPGDRPDEVIGPA